MTIKVLQVTTVATTLNAFLLPFAQQFRSLDWQVDAAAEGIGHFESVQDNHSKCFEVGFCRNPLKIHTLISSLITIRRILVKENYDFVHVHTPIAAFLTRIASIGVSHTKVFYTAHGFHYTDTNPFWKNYIFYALEKIMGKATDHLFVINQDDFEFAISRHLLDDNDITLIPGIGINPDKYAYSPLERKLVRDSFKIREDSFVILQVAELNKNKDHQTVIRALKVFHSANPEIDFKYLIVGVGSMQSELEDFVEELGLSQYVEFLGYRNDVSSLYSGCDVVVLSSLREGLPRCLLEAMATGRPIIASNIRGCKDLLASGAGELVVPGDYLQWARAIERIQSQSDTAKTMGERGVALVEERYKEEKVISAVIDVYRREVVDV